MEELEYEEMTFSERFIKKLENYIASGKVEDEESFKRIKQYIGLLKEEFHTRYEENGRLEFNDRKNIMSDIAEVLKPQNTAFVFGAGVSCAKPFELPGWNKLLRRAIIGEYLNEYRTSAGFDELDTILSKSDEYSGDYFGSFDLYELGQIIENQIKARYKDRIFAAEEIERIVNNDMYAIVRRALNMGLDPKRTHWKENGLYYVADDEDAIKKEIENSFLGELCKTIERYKVSRVITYNYDNAFEYCYNVCGCGKYYSVYLDDQLPRVSPRRKILPVYHVHGYIPVFELDPSGEQSEPSEEYRTTYADNPETKSIVLSENSYDSVAHSSYKWRNTVQIDTFLRYNCLFFGFSATDKNFNRIVKLMDWHVTQAGNIDKHAVMHYIFLTVDEFINNIFNTSIDRLVEQSDDTDILLYPGLYKKRVRMVLLSLYESFLAIRNLNISDMPSELNGFIEDISKVVCGLNNNEYSYTAEDNYDDYIFDEEVKRKCLSLFTRAAALYKDLKTKMPADKRSDLFGSALSAIGEKLTDFTDGERLLADRLAYLYYTLRSKRTYLRGMNIYPVWITMKDSYKYIEILNDLNDASKYRLYERKKRLKQFRAKYPLRKIRQNS